MRALCEGCGKPQPPDWKAGDLCSFCGKAVRHDVRCYWCAKWVPAAKFCRSCGAAVVEERLYGAARMLKDAGTDRFTIPKQLKEFDPDQIENFSRIYQRHAIAVAGHVDACRYAEQFLRQKHWSAALEDQLIPQLPWNEETLARMTLKAILPGEPPEALQIIGSTTPFPTTRSLAALARLRLDDFAAYKDAAAAFRSDDPTLKAEAALALTTWRVLVGYGRPRDFGREVYQELEKSTFKAEAAVGMALLGGAKDGDFLKDALASSDKVVAFGAALALGDVDRLQAALSGDELEKIAAGNKLIELGIIKPVVKVVEKSPLEVQQELVESLIRRKEPAPEAADTLMQIVETTGDETLRERAARILCRKLHPEWVLRIARAAKDDRHIFQSLLQAPDLAPEGAVELGDFLLERGFFRMHQYGLSGLAEQGRMPETFVPTRFARADEETQREMLRFVETQLNRQQGEDLHKFVLGVVFGAYSAKTRAAAWWTLHRSYRHHGEHRGEGPFKLHQATIERFFGSVGAFVPKLTAVLGDHATLKEVGYYEMIAHLLTSADDEAVAAIQAEESVADGLVHALLDAMRQDYWPNTLEGMVRLLSRVAAHPRWRDRALEAIRGLGKKGSYYYDKALRRLELSAHGIPEESEWNDLPPDFAPARFAAASPEGRREFLKLAEHQLIHRKSDAPVAVLGRFLLDAALRPGDPEVRAEALDVYAERMRPESFPLRKDAVETSFGPLPEFLTLAAATLRDASAMANPRFLNFFAGLLDDPRPADGEMLAQEGDAARSFLRSLLELAATPPGETRQVNLRRDAIRFLEKAGAHAAWRDEVVAGLERIRSTPGCDLASECDRVLRILRPPPDTEQRQHRIVEARQHPGSAPPSPPEENPYVAKQRIAEQMGRDLQSAIMALMAGPASPEEKMREATRMSEEFQAKIKQLYS